MINSNFPEPVVGALIFNPEGEILLLKSHKWKDKYVVPGGHIELGESLQDALVREVKEETGLDIHSIEFLFFQEFIYDEAFWKKKHFIFFDFVCKTDSSKVILNSEASEYSWVSLDELGAYSIGTYTDRAIMRYKNIHKELL